MRTGLGSRLARIVIGFSVLVLFYACGGSDEAEPVPNQFLDMSMDTGVINQPDLGMPMADSMVMPSSDMGDVEMMPDAFIPTGTGTSPGVGEIIFSEIHYDPHFGLSDTDAEWLELYNVTGRSLSLEDCSLSDGTDIVALGEILMPANSYALFARNEDPTLNGNLMVSGIFPFALNNLSDRLELRCGNAVIDVLAYDLDEGFPRTKGFSVSLDPNHLTAEGNDDPSNWCFPRRVYLEDPIQWGTPGGANTKCDEIVDQCRLQSPTVIPDMAAGLSGEYRDVVEIYGRVREDTLTDRTTANDATGLVRAQLGFGMDGTNPEGGEDWIWIYARPNSAYNANTAGEPAFDEYVATLYIPTPARYDFAYRFSVDGGRNWTYCDGGEAGSLDGYDLADAGDLDAQPPSAPCEPNPCQVAPRGVCEGTVAKAYLPNGTCSADAIGLPACSFEFTETDCAATGSFCAFGRCYDTQPGPPISGDIIVTELMYNPDDARDEEALDTPRLYESNAEWIELYNTTLRPISLDGCVLTDYDANRPQPESPSAIEAVVIAPESYALFARDDDPIKNGGLSVDGTFSFNLTNNGDTVILRCNNAEIDRVSYGREAGFPSTAAASLSLDANAYNATQNDLGGAWCAGDSVYLESPQHLGTPGEANLACPRCVDVVCETPAPECEGNAVRTYSEGACAVESFVESCEFPSELEPCDPDKECREGTCVDAGTMGPERGDIIVSEVMFNPGGDLSDSTAEWFEMVNISDRPIWLGGCQISDGSGVTQLRAVYAEAGQYLLFIRDDDPSVNGGLQSGTIFDFSLNNNGDLLELRCGETVIDAVIYDATFPGEAQVSMNLDPMFFDEIANDAADAWCLSTEVYWNEPEHLGTPGLTNTSCTP